MKVVVSIGFVIVFIATFFVMALGSTLLKGTFNCQEIPDKPDKYDCELESYDMNMFVTFFLVMSFVIADIGAVYLMMTNWIV